MAIIEDGAGTGYTARVNSDNRLFTFAESVPAGTVASANKKMWGVSTGNITLTSANTSGIAYLKYAGVHALVIPRITFTTGASTGGSDNATWVVRQNSTTGTLVSNATALTTLNRNFSGTSGSLTGSQFKGVEGATVTNGTEVGSLSLGAGIFTLDINDFPYVLENGNSISVEVTPPASNTSQTNRIFIVAYELVVS